MDASDEKREGGKGGRDQGKRERKKRKKEEGRNRTGRREARIMRKTLIGQTQEAGGGLPVFCTVLYHPYRILHTAKVHPPPIINSHNLMQSNPTLGLFPTVVLHTAPVYLHGLHWP
jgi:hypothetical protein